MVIGLVLSSVPGYSETFFRNKIHFLTAAGIKVIIFTNNPSNTTTDYHFVEGFSWKGSWFFKVKQTLLAFIRIMLSLKKTQTLYRLNKQTGYSKKENFLSLLACAHILKFNLNWLHFGFATMALGKENLAKTIGAQMAVSIRGYDIAIYPMKNHECYRLLWERLDKLHYISDDLLSIALNQGFNSKISHQKITPAIDTSLFQGRRRSTIKTPLKIVTVARLHWKKGLEYTLEALSILNKREIDFEYTVIGSGEDYERLVYAGYQLGIKEKIRFVGKKTQEEIKEVFQESDIYLQYSVQEGFCNSALEAQAMGLLCIVSNAEGLTENILNNETGWIVPKRKPELLADQIIKVLNLTASDRVRISQAAVERTKKQFDLEKQKKDFETFYVNQ